ncbi:cell wall hydrolase [Parvibaculum sp.]|uniref:cell wall hydrolase n=1 Tax=Parvibaculum sp. TaxID=2024848 RepID=UPI002C92FA56|nr:cell wall hydrolase [Parvibaculum sp.]HUD50514.1 cell wall hydrolase [Parvibaculum sp.]
MRRLLEWLDVSHAISGALHVTVGLVGLAVVSGALLSSMTTTEALPVAAAAIHQVASATPADGQILQASLAVAAPSIAVPAVFRQADATSALVQNAVAVTPAIHIDLRDLEKERRCLTEGIYFEARGESAVGQLAVAEVIVNRVTSGLYPASICGVVFQGQKSKQCQFSFACNGDMDRPRDPVAWRKAQKLAHYVLAGKVRTSIVGPATYYHATYVSPNWAQSMIEVAKIGQHVFYRTADANDFNPS